MSGSLHQSLAAGAWVVLAVGWLCESIPYFRVARPKPTGWTSRLLLTSGTMTLGLAIGFGLLLGGSKGDFSRWDHAFTGYWAACVFGGLTLWRFKLNAQPSALMLILWFAALGLLGVQITGHFALGGK